MTPYKCANCEKITELPDVIKKFVCPVCGVLNTPRRENAGTGDEACCCLLPTGFEWRLPAGEFETPNGILYSTIGLGDLYGGVWRNDKAQVMTYYSKVKRTLGNGDKNGTWQLYG